MTACRTLKVGSRLDEVQIAQLKLHREAHENYVRNVYQSRIVYLEGLEAQAKAAAKAAKSTPKKK